MKYVLAKVLLASSVMGLSGLNAVATGGSDGDVSSSNGLRRGTSRRSLDRLPTEPARDLLSLHAAGQEGSGGSSTPVTNIASLFPSDPHSRSGGWAGMTFIVPRFGPLGGVAPNISKVPSTVSAANGPFQGGELWVAGGPYGHPYPTPSAVKPAHGPTTSYVSSAAPPYGGGNGGEGCGLPTVMDVSVMDPSSASPADPTSAAMGMVL